MSLISLKLEEGTARQISRELRNGGENRVSKIFRRGFSYFVFGIIKHIARILFWSFIIVVGYLLLGILKLINYATRDKSYLLLCVIAIIFDPLFFYIPVLNDENKCIELDQKVGITAVVLRSVFDFPKTIHIFSELNTKLRKNGWKQMLTELRRNYGWKRVWLLFFIDILAILPIPQVLVIFRIEGWKFLSAMSFLPLQYLPRIIRTYFLFTEQATGMFAEGTLAIVGFNLLLFMHGGLVFGALWYFYAIEKATACWKKACINHTECRQSSFHCGGSLRDYSFINDFCGIKIGNTSSYNFGLFNDALQSGIVEESYFPKKFFHCLQWGLQNLSAFGQNLQTSTEIWENIFAICVTSYGVVFFVFLIAKMQFDISRSRRIKQKVQEMSRWPQFSNLSWDVQRDIREYKRHNWQNNKPLDVVNVLDDLPEDIGRKIKQDIGLRLLKKVMKVEPRNEKLLEDLSGSLKPISFLEHTHILRKDEPISEMLFVIKGALWTYPTPTGSDTKNYLTDGDVCGEEVIAWARNESSSDLPISTRNIQAVTKVDAFALLAYDLKPYVSLFSEADFERPNQTSRRAAQLIQSYWRFRRIYRRRKARTFTERLSSKLKHASKDELGKCWK